MEQTDILRSDEPSKGLSIFMAEEHQWEKFKKIVTKSACVEIMKDTLISGFLVMFFMHNLNTNQEVRQFLKSEAQSRERDVSKSMTRRLNEMDWNNLKKEAKFV